MPGILRKLISDPQALAASRWRDLVAQMTKH
jgi:hypothetical protein